MGKRVLYYGLSHNRGGIETYLYKICRRLDRKKYEIAFLDETGGHAMFRKELEAIGARFYDITPRRVSPKQNRRDLEVLFEKEHFDILHFNCNTLSYITPLIIAQRHGVSILLHSRNSKCTSKFITRLLHFVNRARIQAWDVHRVAVSDLAGKWLFGKRDYEVFNNGIEVENFTFDEEKRNAFRKELMLEGKTVYCNVGGFLKVKNHQFLVEIFQKIFQADCTSVLLLAGDGPLQRETEEQAKKLGVSDRVCFLGTRGDIFAVLMASDCMIFPSFFEGFPNAVIEAETTGLPVLMSDVITPEVCLTEQCVRMPLSASAGEWAEKAIALAKMPQVRNDAADIIREKGYSAEAEISRLENLYEKMACE